MSELYFFERLKNLFIRNDTDCQRYICHAIGDLVDLGYEDVSFKNLHEAIMRYDGIPLEIIMNYAPIYGRNYKDHNQYYETSMECAEWYKRMENKMSCIEEILA